MSGDTFSLSFTYESPVSPVSPLSYVYIGTKGTIKIVFNPCHQVTAGDVVTAGGEE